MCGLDISTSSPLSVHVSAACTKTAASFKPPFHAPFHRSRPHNGQIHTCVSVYCVSHVFRACVRACVRGCVRACVCVWLKEPGFSEYILFCSSTYVLDYCEGYIAPLTHKNLRRSYQGDLTTGGTETHR